MNLKLATEMRIYFLNSDIDIQNFAKPCTIVIIN